MPLRRVGRLVALWTVVGALACVRDDWRYYSRSPDAGSPSDVATDAPDDRPLAIDAPPADSGSTDIGTTDIGSTDIGSTDIGTTDIGTTDIGTTDIGTTDVGTTDTGTGCPAGMALIPAGQFLMGDATGTEPLALPVHGVRLRAFCLDVTEVTVRAYRECPTAMGCTPTATLPACNWGVSGRDDHPINCVTAEQAIAYCVWRGGASLPTEAQWEYAARGVDGRMYPWGPEAPGAQLCWSGGGTIQPNTCPVRMFPAGARGLFDMGGGIAELTSDRYFTYTGNMTTYVDDPVSTGGSTIRIIRGGNWRSTSANDVRAWYREGLEVSYSTGVGFRCMRQ